MDLLEADDLEELIELTDLWLERGGQWAARPRQPDE
jgi:hypothetical protein